ncbi:hypothetical protein B7755_030525 [Streptomyces sp. NBS 14/10]|uniref:hypothetical protein n=1 Tax=Streptomyces sp. NBS 14/10 TaxID=1945643 RepID=UPI000B7C647B|nr:hypothetical protein [Streptomyces sp. NBS 14/10]KAK1182093.1 hypothetical protein B7755_030525 [Streptomyces sp. NBS 14/10]NUS84846.1 hypothetical protein [Streptomyces sp.]
MNTNLLLYARSRALPVTIAVLIAAAPATAWFADWLVSGSGLGPRARLPVVVLAPLLVSAAIGASLYTHSEELDRTAVRPWWPRRGCQLLLLTAVAAGLLALAVPGESQVYGAYAMARNVLGSVGVTALAAALIGARLSWLPMLVHTGAVYFTARAEPGGSGAVWAWSVQPGPQRAAWWTAAALFAAGSCLYALRGARPEGPGSRR